MNPEPASGAAQASGREAVLAVLGRRTPPRMVYAPNYWQWTAHHRNHGSLPAEIGQRRTQLELIEFLGLDVFSRNLYCDEQKCWFGGLADEVWEGVECRQEQRLDGQDRVIEKTYRTRMGEVTERLRYVFGASTLVQEKFAVTDYASRLDVMREIVAGRRWKFFPERYARVAAKVGDRGVVMAGELYSPLKMLHMMLGPADTTFLLTDEPERAGEMLAMHEAAQLDLAAQMAASGVAAMIAMDNLDTMFHTPQYVERYSASFYEKASRICHAHGSAFFIHACGRQKANLKLIAGLGVDGLEGVAFPPLGDVELDEAMRLSGDRFIITGGISAMETGKLRSRREVEGYVQELLGRMQPYAHRFMLSASCNTPINTPWETIRWLQDAWREYGATR